MQAVLFDLDGTLLDIDIESFLPRYFAALSTAIEEIVDSTDAHKVVMKAIFDATNAMMRPHPGLTNQTAFSSTFEKDSGMDLEVCWPVFDRFYEEVFPTLRAGIGPSEGAHDALRAARACGLRVAVATNPIFPLRAIEHRITWADFEPGQFDAITSYENMRATKPLPDYFRQTAEMLKVDPAECMMVGDDRLLDMAAADVGMSTYYVGADSQAPATYRGSLSELAASLPRLCEG